MTPLLSRLGALALLMGLAALIVFGALVPAVHALQASHEEEARLEDAIDRTRRATSVRTAVEHALEQALAALEAQDLVLPPQSEPEALARLQQALQAIGDSAGADIRRVRVLPSEDMDDFRKIAVELELAATVQSLAAVLSGIEAGAPLMVVETMRVQAGRAYRNDRRGGAPETNTTLRVAVMMRRGDA